MDMRYYLKRNLLVVFIIIGLAINGNSQTVTRQLDTLLTAYAGQYKFNGAVLVAKNGKVLLEKGYGWRNAKNKIANEPSSVFQLGSITKQFTAAIILKLEEQNKLQLTDKLSKYFPAYPKGDSITIHQLLSHTSGIYSYTNDENFMNNEITKPHTREQMMVLFRDKPLRFSPGTRWEYSNSGYSLLGYIIEDITHKTYEQAVRDYIFDPLKMTNSGFDFAHLKSPDKTTGYLRLNENDMTEAPLVDSSVSYAAGSVYSMVGDLYKWHKALLNNVIMSKALQEKAYTPVKSNYGYGWIIDSADGMRVISHSGGIHGFNTNFARVPEDDVCIVLLNNASNSYLEEITKSILALLYNKHYELPKKRTAISVSENILKEYAGEYQLFPGFTLTVSVKEGQLKILPTGQPEIDAFAEKEDFFFLKVVDAQIQFKRNDKEEVAELVLFQGGREMPGKKIK